MNLKIIAGITNWNRCELLKENILAVLKQSYPVEIIHIVDNGSTDGSKEMVKELQKKYDNIVLVECETNLGSAGGRRESLRFTYECSYDYCWILDDDSIPTKDCLKNLIENPLFSKKDLFLSRCENNNGGLGNPLMIDYKTDFNLREGWDKHLEKGLIRLNTATFCSCLISRWLIERIGYPVVEMNVWGEDTEYCARVNSISESHIYLVGKSVVIHKRKLNTIKIWNENDPNRLKNYYCMYRNYQFAMKDLDNLPTKVRIFYYLLKHFGYVSLKCWKKPLMFKKWKIIWLATIEGIFFNPKLEMVSGTKVGYWQKHKRVDL
jgi:GT2 family glycosyltransferase